MDCSNNYSCMFPKKNWLYSPIICSLYTLLGCASHLWSVVHNKWGYSIYTMWGHYGLWYYMILIACLNGVYKPIYIYISGGYKLYIHLFMRLNFPFRASLNTRPPPRRRKRPRRCCWGWLQASCHVVTFWEKSWPTMAIFYGISPTIGDSNNVQISSPLVDSKSPADI